MESVVGRKWEGEKIEKMITFRLRLAEHGIFRYFSARRVNLSS